MKPLVKSALIFTAGCVVGAIPAFIIGHISNHVTLAGSILRTQAILQGEVTAIRLFHGDYGRWPTTLEELRHNPKNRIYLDLPPEDSWGHPLKYVMPTEMAKTPTVMSLGADNSEGGILDSADISISVTAPQESH